MGDGRTNSGKPDVLGSGEALRFLAGGEPPPRSFADEIFGRRPNLGTLPTEKPVATPGADRSKPVATPGSDKAPPATPAPKDTGAPAKPADRTTEKGAPLDRISQIQVFDGVLEVSYKDPDLARKITDAKHYDTINIADMPKGSNISHWVDEKGYFFWFTDGHDGNKRYYYPENAKAITVNGNMQDLTLQRMKVNEAYAKKHLGGYQSMDKGSNVFSYVSGMARYGDKALDVQAHALEESAKNSKNPYFKIYLADIYVAQAMKPIINDMLTTGSANPNNPATLKKLDDAIKLLQTVQGDSTTELGKINRKTAGNIVMPLDPYTVYNNPRDGYFMFWGGSHDQARHREVALTMLKAFIEKDALPKFELPPALPPR